MRFKAQLPPIFWPVFTRPDVVHNECDSNRKDRARENRCEKKWPYPGSTSPLYFALSI